MRNRKWKVEASPFEQALHSMQDEFEEKLHLSKEEK